MKGGLTESTDAMTSMNIIKHLIPPDKHITLKEHPVLILTLHDVNACSSSTLPLEGRRTKQAFH